MAVKGDIEDGRSSQGEIPDSPRGLKGHDFEDWLARNYNGRARVKYESREFDVEYDGHLIEAKSGWSAKSIHDFQSIAGEQFKIANRLGKIFEVHSNVPIPSEVKLWLEAKRVPYVEHLW